MPLDTTQLVEDISSLKTYFGSNIDSLPLIRQALDRLKILVDEHAAGVYTRRPLTGPGSMWSIQDNDQLYKMFQDKVSTLEMSAALNRSPSAIEKQLKILKSVKRLRVKKPDLHRFFFPPPTGI